jgi:hypothetical protein
LKLIKQIIGTLGIESETIKTTPAVQQEPLVMDKNGDLPNVTHS